MTKSSGHVLVPWSGGADSTLTLMMALEANPGNTTALILDCTQFPREQFSGELRARKAAFELIYVGPAYGWVIVGATGEI